ncbi:MAG: nucleotidyltransferase domain-containing protein [Candidatus Freyarchaeum deiterrae]
MVNDIWIEKFQKEALPRIVQDIKPERVLFFGSRVTGNAKEESDLDVIIISEAFRGIPFIKRAEKVLKTARFPKHVDYLCYTPEEFERIKTTSSIIQDAMEQNVEATL